MTSQDSNISEQNIKTTSLVLPPDIIARIAEEAQAKDISKSAVVRKILRKAFKMTK